jgi:hypothetical protein
VGNLAVGAAGVLDVSALAPGFTLWPNLSGEGEVIGAFTAFGSVSPGTEAAPIATLTTGSITFDFFFNADFDSEFPAADRLVVNGDLKINSLAELVLSDLAPFPAALPAGTKFALIEYTGAWDGSTFQYFDLFDVFDLIDLTDGSAFTFDSNTFVIDYNDTSDGMKAGKFVTLTVPGGGGAFDTWAGSEGLDGSAGKEAGFGENPEGDTLANGLEWILGGDPLGQDGATVLPTPKGDAVNGLTWTFTREEDSIGAAALLVQWNTDLGAAWNDVVVGPASSGPDADGVRVDVNTAADPDVITVTIPADNAVNGNIFARLQASMP